MSPAFDHRGDGTPAELWSPLIAALPEGDGAGTHDHLLVLAAHPDDETLGAGGVIADAAQAGAQVTVVVASDGEASHPDSPTHTRDELAGRRREEIRAAIAVLAPQARLVLLGLPDGDLRAHAHRVADALVTEAADATVVAATWRHDGHPDHEACGEVAATFAQRIGARLLEYPVWGWHWGEPGSSGPLEQGDGPDGHRWVARRMTAAAREAKTAALCCFTSQHTRLSDAAGDEPVLGPHTLQHFVADVEVLRAGPPRDLPARYFDRLWSGTADPWQLESGFYERRKRELLLAALPRPRFRRAFEPGCATGLVTALLARRCDTVVARDVSAAAVGRTDDRLRAQRDTDRLGHVDLGVGAVPGDWPDGRFDLVVISELGYYLADVEPLAARIRDCLTPDGVVAAVHWRHAAAGYPSTAGEVHATLGRHLLPVATHVEQDFLLDVWSLDGRSVARAQGLVE